MHTRPSLTRAIVTVATMTVAAAGLTTAQAAASPPGAPDARGAAEDPSGNNGTVKITPHGEADGIPQNTPHVGCLFDVEWYGFDRGDDIRSTVEFATQAPTRSGLEVDGPAQVFVGGDEASGAGTDSGFDGEAGYTLSFDGEPHPQQGYHVKLTIHTPGSRGADTKHKVFWVQECGDTPSPEVETSPSPEVETSPSPEVETPPSPEVAGEEETAPEASSTRAEAEEVEVKGAQASQGAPTSSTPVPTAVDAGAEVTSWAGSPLALLVVLLGGLLAGAGLVTLRRRRS